MLSDLNSSLTRVVFPSRQLSLSSSLIFCEASSDFLCIPTNKN